MDIASTSTFEEAVRPRVMQASLADPARSVESAVSWGAIVAGAAAAASLSLILLILGVGLGLSSVSPWAHDGASATSLGVSTIVWLTLTQLLASAMGGYLAGRLRTKWTEFHTDDGYFRDTAHGFLAWAVASLATAALLTSVIGSILSGGAQAGASIVGSVADTAGAALGGVASASRMAPGNEGAPMGYFIDSLFRRNPVEVAAATTATTAATGFAASPAGMDPNDRAPGREAAEVTRIVMNVGRFEPLPAEDMRYVAQIVAQRTGLSQQDAERRVVDVFAKAHAKLRDTELAVRETADTARTASAYSALWLFVSLLVGAFVASLAATFGGQRRDA
jgi:hypothetical protein